MKIKAVVAKIEKEKIWLGRIDGGENSCRGCSGCGGADKCGFKTGPLFPASNPSGYPVKTGMIVTASCSALKTVFQILISLVFPVAAATAAYIYAPTGETGGIKIAAMLAAFTIASVTVIFMAEWKKKAGGSGSGGEMEITEILY